MVPESCSGLTPCSSAATMQKAMTGRTAPFIVIETEMRSNGMALEENLDVFNGIDRDAGLAHVGEGARMIGIISAMSGQIKGDRQSLLSCGDVAPIEGIALLRRGKSGVLPHRPRARHIHRAVRSAPEWRQAGHALETFATGGIGRGRRTV